MDGEILNLKRLKELEKLAGLCLEPAERDGLLADLVRLERFVAGLPEISDDYEINSGQDPPFCQAPSLAEIDLRVVWDNAPCRVDGYYAIPPVRSGNGDELE